MKHVCAVTRKDECHGNLAQLADLGTTLACDAGIHWHCSAERAASELHAMPLSTFYTLAAEHHSLAMGYQTGCMLMCNAARFACCCKL